MNPETRRVTVFVIVGLSAAVLIAVMFWRAGSPSPAPVAHSATTSATVDTQVSGADRESVSEVSPSPTPAAEASTDSREFVAPEENDPFLAPNAVAQTPRGVAPSSVYRPRNVGEQPRLHQDEPTALPPSETVPETPSPSTTGSGLPETAPQTPTTTPAPTPAPTPATSTPMLPEIPQIPSLPGLTSTPSVPTEIPLPMQIPAPQDQVPVETNPEANPAPANELPGQQPSGSGFWPFFPWWR